MLNIFKMWEPFEPVLEPEPEPEAEVFCVDCKHCAVVNKRVEIYKCIHPKVRKQIKQSLVTGKPIKEEITYCSVERAFSNIIQYPCGEEGKLFEAKDE